jgi:hypothetical protein
VTGLGPDDLAANSTHSSARGRESCEITAAVRSLVKHSSQVGVLVIVQIRRCPAVIVPLQSLLNEVVKLRDGASVTLYMPGPNLTSTLEEANNNK